MKIAFVTLGCKVNQYETAVLEGLFSENGFEISENPEAADVCVVNSCTVTASADQKTRQTLRRIRRENPGAVLVLTGCYPQASPESADLPEADIITGTRDRAQILPLVKKFLADHERIVSVLPHERREAFEEMSAGSMPGHTRAFVKIEDGCEQFCSYCAIPFARGPVRSKPLDEITAELARLAAAGHREVVLSGINLPCYGRDLGLRLIDAVEAACAVPGIDRVRLGSLEPERLTEEDVARMAAQPRVCDQFHFSLQSGCDETLRRMNRRYTTAEYAAQSALLRRYFPNAALTTDVMTGFPGETDEEFAQSLEFVRSIGFAKVHVFPYSRRPGTRADKFPGQLSRKVKEERAARMSEAAAASRRDFLASQLGRTEEVLFEDCENGFWHGYTTNYTPVYVRSEEPLHNELVRVMLTAPEGDGLLGVLIK